uniref:Secreted protein n=1 Tax=Heterorhabditis bacteriophora TaxID=37862 RepID=A0A1I7WZK2_HETBA
MSRLPQCEMNSLRPPLLCVLGTVFFHLCRALHPIYSQLEEKAMPRNDRSSPLHVHVGFYVESLGNFRSTEMVHLIIPIIACTKYICSHHFILDIQLNISTDATKNFPQMVTVYKIYPKYY